MKSLRQILDERTEEKKRRAPTEYSAFAYRLAKELDDLEDLKMYIRLAKTIDRGILEETRRFVLDSQTRNKRAKFLWKMKELRRSRMERDGENTSGE